MGRGKRRAAAAAKAPGKKVLTITLNMAAVARFLWAAEARKIAPLRDVYAAKLAALGAREGTISLPCPTGLTEGPQFNARALYSFCEHAKEADIPTLQAILATVRIRVG